ncbi:hypothetical protein [Prescottella agglutinans]|uniref:Uncharacterized protein n=1 Tax=Prescottella agglutinans TaxID=1644129 RepID=A0ABT6MF29_9NOCA|nr:hypothetical protein [Prescottella agglutinans]MDH6282877.1 hypothetical protein [Prescottella agglutinans]
MLTREQIARLELEIEAMKLKRAALNQRQREWMRDTLRHLKSVWRL